MPLLIAALLALSAALIVLYPLLGLIREPAAQMAAPAGQTPAADAAEREQQARQALREVEFDYTLGNLETGDYEELRERYENRALAALKSRYQREQELDAQIERRLDALRQSEAAAPTSATPQRRPTPAKVAPAAPKPAPHARAGASTVRDRRAPRRKGP